MKSKIHIKNLVELFPVVEKTSNIRKKINCISFDCEDVVSHFTSPVYLDALIGILVLSGKGRIDVNYRAYSVTTDSLLLLSSSHLFHFYECSSDFRCLCLFVGRGFMSEMDSTDMIYRRIKYGVRLYNTPVLRLNPSNAQLISERIRTIDKAIDHPEHFYYKEVVLNALFSFYLDLSDMIERYPETHTEGNLTRYESIIKSFIELLALHYREEHKVEFYAAQLNLSAHYLTLIVKRVTGQSVCDFIFEMLYSDACTLLTHSKLSVQEIASLLNFSDQSAFGKFFKRKAGLSPIDYRKNS